MVRPENVKKMEQNVGKNILATIFLDVTPKAQTAKAKQTNRFMRPKSFYTVEVIINKETTYERAEDISKSSIS